MTHPDQGSPTHHWAHPNLFFNYERLDTPSSFRLLQIKRPPDDTDAPCHYSLFQTTLDQAPRYETLSYVWGTTDQSEMVKLIDGKILRVTKPLKEALPFVERQCSTGYLWIDQICIDQDDRNERSHQVKLMGQIYTSCSRVLVWLGLMAKLDDDPEQSQLSRDTLAPKISTMRYLIHHLRKVTGSGESSMGSHRPEILQSPWFQRAWVFQEVVLPPSALFILATISTLPRHALTISLSELHARVNSQAEGTYGADAVADTIRMMYRRCSEHRQKNDHLHWPIEQTLSHLAPRAKTSEELDRLYAFFGLNFDTSINLTPSYDSSLEVAMIDTAISIIEGARSLDLFEVIPRAVTRSLDLFEVIPRAMESTIDDKGIPTWTPDFRQDHLVVPFKRSNDDFRQLAKSTPELYPVFIPTQITYYRYVNRYSIFCAGEEKRMIQAHGFVLDHVDTEIGSLPSRTTIETHHLDVLLERCIKAWTKIKRVEHKDSSASRNKSESTGLAGFTVDLGFALEPTEERLRRALTAEGRCALSYEHLPPCASDSTGNVSSTEQTMMQDVMRGRTLWMTRSGRLSLGSYLRRGDHICLAYGCSNPIALRGEHKMTTVLGTCFLEGWMGNGNIARAKENFDCTVFHII
ncbi:heterokaryon incompatibility protein-domain-containing protein [Clohesyomyces aquaticus]|uniref:Heterokaryon incompatibility protein-domain-containing protein n=1 Tax=Clohesyomyces aquaticus TaxID=1231657 RepID=A0A1Y1YMI0_9PLEO|nr:heterokaryon incompatibility protein-domain-containing protein [Clohesyomyces aquaticus]